MASKIKGAEELMKVMKQLPNAMGVKAVQSATRSGATVLRKGFDAAVGKPGVFTIKNVKDPNMTAAMQVGLKKENWHYIFSEFGTKPHTILSNKQGLANVAGDTFFGTEINHPGVAPNPRVRTAFDTIQFKAAEKVVDSLGRTVTTQAKKLAGKYSKTGLQKRRRR